MTWHYFTLHCAIYIHTYIYICFNQSVQISITYRLDRTESPFTLTTKSPLPFKPAAWTSVGSSPPNSDKLGVGMRCPSIRHKSIFPRDGRRSSKNRRTINYSSDCRNLSQPAQWIGRGAVSAPRTMSGQLPQHPPPLGIRIRRACRVRMERTDVHRILRAFDYDLIVSAA